MLLPLGAVGAPESFCQHCSVPARHANRVARRMRFRVHFSVRACCTGDSAARTAWVMDESLREFQMHEYRL